MQSEERKSKLCYERCYVLQPIKLEEQFSELLTLCQYMFYILAHDVIAESDFSLMSVQWPRTK